MDQQLLYNITCGFVAYTRRVQQIRLPEFPNPFDLLELSPQNRIPSTYALSGSLERILPRQGRFLWVACCLRGIWGIVNYHTLTLH